MNTGEWIQLLALLAAVATIIFTQINTNRYHKLLLEQSQWSMFAEYTKRYQDIIIRMPDEVYDGTAKFYEKEVAMYMRLYFDLCSEEYHLWQIGIIPNDVWNNWKEGMQTALNRKPFRSAWYVVKGSYNTDFYKYFEREVVNWKTQQPQQGV